MLIRFLAAAAVLLALSLGSRLPALPAHADTGSSFSVSRIPLQPPATAYSLAAGASDATYRLTGDRSQLHFHMEKGNQSWDVTIGAPTGQLLVPGTYTGAQPEATDTAPQLIVSGNSEDCGITTGSFSVQEITVNTAGTVVSLHASFDKTCYIFPGSGPPREEQRGTLAFVEDEPYSSTRYLTWDSSTAQYRPASRSILRFFLQGNTAATALDSSSSTMTLTGNARSVLLRADQGAHEWTLRIAAPRFQELHVGHYGEAYGVGYAMGRSATLDLTTDGQTCPTDRETGSFDVRSLAVASDSAIQHTDVTFTIRCFDPSSPAILGEMTWNMPSSGTPIEVGTGNGTVFMHAQGFGPDDIARTYTSKDSAITLGGGPRFVDVAVRQSGTPAPGRELDYWDIMLSAGQGHTLSPGTYPVEEATDQIRTTGSTTPSPGLLIVGNSHTCNRQTGSFTINAITFGTDGLVTSLDADVDEHCIEDKNASFSGTIAFQLQGASAAPTVAATSSQVAVGSPLAYIVTSRAHTGISLDLQGQAGSHLLFRTHVRGKTDAHGHYVGRVRLLYHPRVSTKALVVMVARTRRAGAVRRFQVTLLPHR